MSFMDAMTVSFGKSDLLPFIVGACVLAILGFIIYVASVKTELFQKIVWTVIGLVLTWVACTVIGRVFIYAWEGSTK